MLLIYYITWIGIVLYYCILYYCMLFSSQSIVMFILTFVSVLRSNTWFTCGSAACSVTHEGSFIWQSGQLPQLLKRGHQSLREAFSAFFRWQELMSFKKTKVLNQVQLINCWLGSQQVEKGRGRLWSQSSPTILFILLFYPITLFRYCNIIQ